MHLMNKDFQKLETIYHAAEKLTAAAILSSERGGIDFGRLKDAFPGLIVRREVRSPLSNARRIRNIVEMP